MRGGFGEQSCYGSKRVGRTFKLRRKSMEGTCPGKSVGGILRRDGKIYLIDRRFEPLGWACPAGHVEKGKTPHEMIAIEFGEEIGLSARSARLVYEEMLTWNNCHRSKDKGHYWYVFEMEDPGGEPIPDAHEAKGGGWFAPDEIEHLHLEPAWRHFFEKLGIIV
jgi:ADP-ribose pyrophosphatase YjhB (NUDIX family)